MGQNTLNIRLKPAIENTSSTKVPLDGEIVFVKDASNTANNNIRIGNGSDAITSLSNFLTLSSGGGATYQTTFNGDPYGDSGGTSLGSWYAPTASGTSGNMLKSNGNNSAPTWDSLENIIGKKTANYVLAGNGTASGNGVVSWQQLSLSSLSDAPNTGTLTLNGTGFSVYSPTARLSKTWYAPESAGTATNLFLKWDTTNSKPIWTTLSNILGSTSGNLLLGDGSTLTKAITTTKINGTSYTALSDTGSAQTQTDSIYAPTDAGSQYNLLVSNGSGAPSWFAQGSNTGLLKFTNGSGWSIDTNSYIPSPTNDNGFLYNNGLGVWSIHSMTYRGISVGGTTILADSVSTYLNLVAGSNITLTPEQSGNQYTGKITIAAALNAATVNTLGGVKLGMANVASGTFAYPSGNTGCYMPLQIDSNGRGRVWEPLVASVNGDKSGLLQVTADANPDKVYINTEYATAIPVFYSDGSKKNVEIYIYDKGHDGKFPYSLSECYVKSKEKVFTGHYVNLEDVINGLIRRPILLAILKDALDNYKPDN